MQASEYVANCSEEQLPTPQFEKSAFVQVFSLVPITKMTEKNIIEVFSSGLSDRFYLLQCVGKAKM